MAGAAGQTTIDFGAVPGVSHVSLNVSSPGIEVGSLVEAWLVPVATNDHSADEHVVDGPLIFAHINSPGVGITIHARVKDHGSSPVPIPGPDPVCYGKWTVGWVHT
jgi:hypothetical protein